ncbi:cysteine proteinase [Aureobasidium sp. EXF-12344]|nr:cysteine proteinase [Aureobasidium sp. EXF-12344]
MKRKPPGGPKPINTLNRLGPGVNALATTTSRGQNVSSSPIKRQKTSHVYPQEFDDLPDDEFFNRGLQGRSSTKLERQPSISAISINSQETRSQRSNPFGHDEARDAHGILNNGKKKGRKPKSGPTQHSSPRQHGAAIDPVSVDDDDDVQILVEQHNVPRPTHHTASEWTPRSPPLAAMFKRDHGEPDLVPETRQAESKLINRMQSTSNTSRIMQPPQVVEDLSEDELSRDPAIRSSARKTNKAVTPRSPSPNAITSTHFTKPKTLTKLTKPKKPEIREPLIASLTSLRMMAGSMKNLHLIYSWADKAMQFTKNGDMLCHKGEIIQVSSKHAKDVFCDLESSTVVILQGAKGGISSGRILFEFNTSDDRDTFLDVVDDMNSKAMVKNLEPVKFTHVRQASESYFIPAAASTNPELDAMIHRRSEPTNRERTLAAQSGFPLPEATSQAPTPRLTRQMKTEYTNQPVAKAAQDHSLPPPKPRIEQATPVRTSGRLQSKDGGKAARPAEPEIERWTVKHGIPKWDAPLVYPAVGPSRTTIDAEDIARLDDGELLNDNIILFCLREMQENNPELKGKAHIFNSFFYETLTSLPSKKKGFNYDGVKRWTRNIDLFSHPYVAVPINTQYHWFLVIICNLDKLERKLNLDGLDDEEEGPKAELQPTIEEPTQSQTTVQTEIEIPESPQEAKDDGLSQGVKRISLDGSQEQEKEFPPLAKLKSISRKGKKQAPPLPKTDPNTYVASSHTQYKENMLTIPRPALILLDSLGGTHPQEIKNLKQYVVHEGRDKRGLEFEYTALKGLTARGLPQQTNFCDCGVYLIGYMEAFVRDPAEFVRKVMSRELDRDNDFADFDPSKKRAEIRDKLIKLEEEQSSAKKQRKKEKARLLRLASQDNDSASPGPPAVQRSSPLKPPAAYADSRMVQSSPVKPPPAPMQKTSLLKSTLYPRSPSRRPPSIERRPVPDEMLFGDAGGSPDELNDSAEPDDRENYSHLGQDNNQPSTFSNEQSFFNQLRQATEYAQTEVEEEEEEDYEQGEGGMVLVQKRS